MTNETISCPYCKEEIKAGAIKCKHCESEITEKKPSHEGICPYCKEEIHPDAIKCKHCKSILLDNLQSVSKCGCSHGSASTKVAMSKNIFIDPVAIPLNSLAMTVPQWPIPGGGEPPIGAPPCFGSWKTFTICLPYIGCVVIRYWSCDLV